MIFKREIPSTPDIGPMKLNFKRQPKLKTAARLINYPKPYENLRITDNWSRI